MSKARNHLTTHIGNDYVAVLREGQATDDHIVIIKYPSKADIALARQFAAAPDLLEACELMLEHSGHLPIFVGEASVKNVRKAAKWIGACDKARAAIAKATGAP